VSDIEHMALYDELRDAAFKCFEAEPGTSVSMVATGLRFLLAHKRLTHEQTMVLVSLAIAEAARAIFEGDWA
jgi:hypothetical protein